MPNVVTIRSWSILITVVVVLSVAGCSRDAASTVSTANDVAQQDTSSQRARSQTGSVHDQRGGGSGVGDCGLSSVYFAYDQSDLDEAARIQLARNARCISSTHPRSVAIVGATDPRGTTEYNLGLGDRRARSAANYISAQGVSPSVLQVRTVGEELATGTDESSWARDRRADFETE